jgi:hypothetical protein
LHGYDIEAILKKESMKKCFAMIGAALAVITLNVFLIGCSGTKGILTTAAVSTTDTGETSTTIIATSITTSQTSITPTTSTTAKTGTSWSLSLVGVITENVNQTLFAQGSAPGCHANYWSDAQGHLWSGISLWLLAAYVDDNNPMGIPNAALWKQGFTIQIISSDGSAVEYSSAQIENNDNIIVAYQMDGKPLPSAQWPLALVGSAVDQQHQVASILEIKLVLPTMTATPLTTAP